MNGMLTVRLVLLLLGMVVQIFCHPLTDRCVEPRGPPFEASDVSKSTNQRLAEPAQAARLRRRQNKARWLDSREPQIKRRDHPGRSGGLYRLFGSGVDRSMAPAMAAERNKKPRPRNARRNKTSGVRRPGCTLRPIPPHNCAAHSVDPHASPAGAGHTEL